MITLKPITNTEIFPMIGKALFIKKKRQYKLIKNRLILKELENFTSKLTAKLLIFVTQNFQDTFESRKRPFISTFFHLYDSTFKRIQIVGNFHILHSLKGLIVLIKNPNISPNFVTNNFLYFP